MALYVIADLHLSDKTPELTRALQAFCGRLQRGDKLIIAGDLFDFFVGIDKADAAQQAVKAAARRARENGIQVCFMQGNRDFLLKEKEAAYFGMELLPDLQVIKAPFGQVLIMHGDALCTNDLKYQRFKRRCRSPLLQLIFRLLPLALRRRIGSRIRGKSRSEAAARTDSRIYGAVPQTIEKYLTKLHCQYLVHGHLHHFLRVQGETPSEKERLCLGAWGEKFSYVRLEDNSLEHIELPLTELLKSPAPS